ncbi:MAG: hypothetical protein JOZ89_02965 [Gammaproteobacteria bacterium]|nr:hypothetical protein [Gammaproteobacteria bacterium]
MRKHIRLLCVPLALLLGACDVQVRDTTPAEFQANHDIGMYPVSATVTRDSMVTPGSVYLFAIGGNQKINLTAGGNEWHGLYQVRCTDSFPLQFLAEWRMSFSVKHKLVPPDPRMIKLTEPPQLRQATIDTSAKKSRIDPAAKKSDEGWVGGVQYRFVTRGSVQITAAHVEPASNSPADTAAAKPIRVLTNLPLIASCGDRAELRLASTQQRAHGTLVIDTDDPQVPHWQTTVEFAPK